MRTRKRTITQPEKHFRQQIYLHKLHYDIVFGSSLTYHLVLPRSYDSSGKMKIRKKKERKCYENFLFYENYCTSLLPLEILDLDSVEALLIMLTTLG